MAVDASGISYFLPLLSFLIVLLIVFAVLVKAKIFEDSKFVQVFISFIVATIFVTAIGARQYVTTVIPWFAVLIVCLFIIFVILGFVGKSAEGMNKGIGIAFLVILIIVFLVSAIKVFGSTLGPYLPGGSGGDTQIRTFTDWLYSGQVLGAILLLVVGVLVSWVLVKAK